MRRLATLSLVLPVLALLVVLLTSSGDTAIRPSALVVLSAGAVFAVVAGTSRKSPRPWLDVPLAGAMGLVASHLLFAPGLPRGHDVVHHLWGVWAVAQEVRAGDLAALWLHGIGLGRPLLQFYGPGIFYATLPFSLAGLNPVWTVKAGYLAFGALAAVSMYFAAVRWTEDRRAGLVAAAAYAFAPYRLLDAHYRSALGECAALALLPLIFYFSIKAVREGGRRRFAVAAIPAALLIVTHPISALMSAIGLGAWLLADGRAIPKSLARMAGIWLLGACLAGFFVVPFADGVRNLEVGRIAEGGQRYLVFAHGLTPRDLLWRRPWTVLRAAGPRGDPIDGTENEMPLYFGGVLLSLLPLAAGARPRVPRGLLALTGLSLVLTLGSLAGWISLVFPPLAAIQFPWRFLGLATFGAAAAAGFAVVRLLELWQGKRWVVLVPGLLAGLLMVDAFPFTGAADWLPSYRGFGWFHRPDPDCGQRWGCWQHEHLLAPYPFRVAGLFLPPAQPQTKTSIFCCVFPEYSTRLTHETFAPVGDRAILARAGVKLFVGPVAQRLSELQPRPYAFWWNGDRIEARRFSRGGGEITVALDGRPGTVIVLEQNFPGWQVRTDQGWRAALSSREGLLKARVISGQRELRFRFQRWPPARIAGWLLTGLASLVFLGLCLVSRRGARPRAGRLPDRE